MNPGAFARHSPGVASTRGMTARTSVTGPRAADGVWVETMLNLAMDSRPAGRRRNRSRIKVVGETRCRGRVAVAHELAVLGRVFRGSTSGVDSRSWDLATSTSRRASRVEGQGLRAEPAASDAVAVDLLSRVGGAETKERGLSEASGRSVAKVGGVAVAARCRGTPIARLRTSSLAVRQGYDSYTNVVALARG